MALATKDNPRECDHRPADNGRGRHGHSVHNNGRAHHEIIERAHWPADDVVRDGVQARIDR
jgi:hypothetical protein